MSLNLNDSVQNVESTKEVTRRRDIFKNVFKNIWNNMREEIKGAKGEIRKKNEHDIDRVKESAKGTIDSMKEKTSGVIDSTKKAVEKVKENENIQNIGKGLGQIGKGTVNVGVGLVGGTSELIFGTLDKGSEKLGDVIGKGCRTAKSKMDLAKESSKVKYEKLKQRGKIKNDIKKINSEIKELEKEVKNLTKQIDKHKSLQSKSDEVRKKIAHNHDMIAEQESLKELKTNFGDAKPKTLTGKLLKLTDPEAGKQRLINRNLKLMSKLNDQISFIKEKEQKIAQIEKQISSKQNILSALREAI